MQLTGHEVCYLLCENIVSVVMLVKMLVYMSIIVSPVNNLLLIYTITYTARDAGEVSSGWLYYALALGHISVLVYDINTSVLYLTVKNCH